MIANSPTVSPADDAWLLLRDLTMPLFNPTASEEAPVWENSSIEDCPDEWHAIRAISSPASEV